MAVAAVLVLIAWRFSRGVERADPASSPAEAIVGRLDSSAATLPIAPSATDSEREPILSSASTAPLAVPPDAAVVTELRGRVVDPAKHPVQGAKVSLHRGQLREFSVLDLELTRATEQISEQMTGPSGEFRFELARGVPVDLHVEAQSFCPALIADRHAGEFVVVPLSAGYRVFGRVTRAKDGVPVFDALVRVFKTGGPSTLSRETRTAGNGSFELRITFKEGATLEIVPQLEQCPGWMKLAFGAEDQVEKNVTVEDGFTVMGKVCVAKTAVPIPDATVGEGWVYRRTAKTDAKGEYRLSGFGDPGVRNLFAKARGFGQTGRADLPGAIDGVMHVDFELTPARSAHGRVVDPSGAPVQGVLAAAIASSGWGAVQSTDWLSSRTDISGRFNIENLTAELRHALLVAMPGFATSVYDFPVEEGSIVDLDLGTFVLGPALLLAGRVEDESGKGIADAEVTLEGANGDRSRLLDPRADDEKIAEHYTDSRSTRSDEQGRFSFGDLPAGSYALEARKRGQPQSAPLVVALVAGEQHEDVRILLPIGSRLFGRVVDPEGRAVTNASLSAEAVAQRESKDASVPSTRSDSEGKFEFSGLSAGEYRCSVYPVSSEQSSSDAPLLWTTTQAISTESQTEFVIVLPRGETIRGTLLDAKGVPAANYSIFVKAQPGMLSTLAKTDAMGEFRLSVAAGSRMDIEVRGRQEDDTWRTLFLSAPAVQAGTHDLKLVLP